MENFYSAYTKTINGVDFYFIKHFQNFSEFKNVPPLLVNYGMHINFYKACKIAMIEDKTIQKHLFDSIEYTLVDAKVVQMNYKKTHSYKHWLNHLPGLIIWNSMRRLLNLGQKVA